MKQTTITERVKIEKIIPGGQGIGTLESGQKVMLFNVLPGEIVSEFNITKKKTHYLEGVATKILKESEKRIEAKDECFLSTSPWQIFNYNYELEQKKAILEELFRQNNISQDEFFEFKVKTDDNDFFYRNKMEYALYWDNGSSEIKLAFHERGSHRKVPILNSSLEKPEIFKAAEEVVRTLNNNGEEARKYQSILLRASQDGIVSGGLYENYQPHPVFKVLNDEILGNKYSYSPNGFFQINLPIYEMALREIKQYIDTEKVLDLYSGVGTIGLSVARNKELILVECDKSAYKELERNCQDSCSEAERHPKPILAKSEDALEFIEPDQTVILDPPRAGCHPKLLEKLLEQTPPTIIYLSCNPATQTRDVKILGEKYKISGVQPFNFFPRTPHLENLIVLKLK